MFLKSLRLFFYLSFLIKLIYSLKTDCDVLSDLYKDFEAGNKISWPENSNECCTVDGITCKDNRIIKINLQTKGFKGKINENIGLFSELSFLDLRYNEIGGTIPDTISSLSKLTNLNLSANLNINGSIPKAICSLDNLVGLYIYNNSLSGEIPSCIGNLPKLEDLCLDSNNLTGHIPSNIGKLSNLKLLDFEKNNLSGPIPESFSELNNLEKINLQGNKELFGEIPEMKNVSECSYSSTSLCVKEDTKTCHNNLRKCEDEDTKKVLEYNKNNKNTDEENETDNKNNNNNNNNNSSSSKSGTSVIIILLLLLLLILILAAACGFYFYKRSKKNDEPIIRSQSLKNILPFGNSPEISRQPTEKSFVVLSPKLEEKEKAPKLTLDNTIFNYVDYNDNSQANISLNEDSKISKSSFGIKTQEQYQNQIQYQDLLHNQSYYLE